MGNHTIDCDFCGEDLRHGDSHTAGCPGPAYEKAVEAHAHARRAAVYKALEPERKRHAEAEATAWKQYDAENPPPVKPRPLWETRAPSPPPTKRAVSCRECNDTGSIDTGNNDLPCDCSAGDRAMFNVAGRPGPVSGAELKRSGY